MFYENHCVTVDQVDADAAAAIAALADNMVAVKLRDVPNRLVIAPDEPSGNRHRYTLIGQVALGIIRFRPADWLIR
ncbi:hypothetical protein Aduo_004741 [Ancylostoma duodenale]